MKTRNFPGRKLQRRISALERLEGEAERLGELTEDRDFIPENIKVDAARVGKEMKVLLLRIKSGGKKFTKKDRSYQAPLSR